MSKILFTFAADSEFTSDLERCSSGLRGTPGKRVNGETVSGVRIHLSPQYRLIISDLQDLHPILHPKKCKVGCFHFYIFNAKVD